MQDSRLPSDSRVSWENGTKGNGLCVLNDDAEVQVYDKSVKETITLSGSEYKDYLREVYGQDYVEYNDNEPDFYPFVEDLPEAQMNDYLSTNESDERAHGDFDGCVTVETMDTDRSKTFSKADSEAADKLGVSQKAIQSYMEEYNLTWHECGDRKHIIMIPSDINNTFTHTGGIGMQRSMDSFLSSLDSIRDKDIILKKEGLQ